MNSTLYSSGSRAGSEREGQAVRGVDGLCGEGEVTPDWRVSITITRNMGELPSDRKLRRSVLIHNIHYFLCEYVDAAPHPFHN